MKYLSIYGIAIWAMFSSFKSDDLIQKRFSDTPTIAANQWSLGLNYGIAGSIRESTKIEPLQSPGVRMNVKYMVQPNMGIMALAGYNALSTSTLVGNKSQYAYATLELAYLLSSLNNNLGVLFHTGPGVGSMWNKDYYDAYANDPLLRNHEDVINLNFGVAPQVAITKNVLFNIDFSYACNFIQDHNFDYTNRPRGIAMMYNLSAGLVFKLNQSNQMVHMLISPTLVSKDSISEILPEPLDSVEIISTDTVLEPLEFKSPDVVEVIGMDTVEDTTQVKISDSVEVMDEETEIPVKGTYKVGDDLVKLFDIKPIRYATAKSEISEESKKELDKLVVIMQDNAGLCVELGSHTDSRASAAFNQKLSERRAKAAYDYVVARGVDASRIGYKGYGETHILNKCLEGVPCSDEEHLVNRRTEFIIRGMVPCTQVSNGIDTAKNVQNAVGTVSELVVDRTVTPNSNTITPLVKGTKVQYRIQFAMSKTQIPVKTFTDKGMGSVYEYQHDGHYKYCTDKVFSSRAKALNDLSLVRGMGYSDAFIAVFQNGVRVK
jgi:outer membrane protein OmpA-like peptidoglycan-associated protein